MNTTGTKQEQLPEGIAEMEATIERLRGEIQRLQAERDALQQGNLDMYRKLISVDF
jgi:septal ring factor EnvC (AmiA/AmiB activator)